MVYQKKICTILKLLAKILILLFNFDKKSHPQVCLEECKYKIKKTQIPKLIKIELKSDSDLDLDSEVESKFDAKLMAKLKKFDSDSE